MSSEENFDLDVSDSESDGYAPAPKKTTKVVSKPKPVTKPKNAPKATKKKVLADKDDNASIVERDESDNEAGPSEPTAAAPNGKKKTASETYTRVRPMMRY